MTKYLILFMISILGIFLFSCDTEPEEVDTPPTTQEALQAVEEYALVNKLFSDAFSETDDAAKYTDEQIDGTKNGTKDGPDITITPLDAVTWPKTVTVDYGADNFLCADGRLRRGIINFETTGFYREEGTVVTITFDNYYQNDHKVEGTQIVTNNGRNSNNNFEYSVVISDGKVTTPENLVINYEENTLREWAEGEPTIVDICDDVYYITGTQNGLSSDSIAYVLTVQQALNVKVCCQWIRGGVLDVDIEGLSTMTVNYGDGTTCDNDATVTYLGEEFPIEM